MVVEVSEVEAVEIVAETEVVAATETSETQADDVTETTSPTINGKQTSDCRSLKQESLNSFLKFQVLRESSNPGEF